MVPHREHVHHLLSMNVPHEPQFQPSGFAAIFLSSSTIISAADFLAVVFRRRTGCGFWWWTGAGSSAGPLREKLEVRSDPHASQQRNISGLANVQVGHDQVRELPTISTSESESSSSRAMTRGGQPPKGGEGERKGGSRTCAAAVSATDMALGSALSPGMPRAGRSGQPATTLVPSSSVIEGGAFDDPPTRCPEPANMRRRCAALAASVLISCNQAPPEEPQYPPGKPP